jgi:hypothetical protein
MYDIAAVPPSGTDRSRFAIDTSPTGIATTPQETIANVYGQLVERLIADTPLIRPNPIEVPIKRVAKIVDEEGTRYRLVDTGVYRGIPQIRPTRTSGKFTKRATRGGAFLDEFLGQRGDEWLQVRDGDVFQAALELAEDEHLTGDPLRKLNEHVARAILARRGLVVHPSEVPL